jgi:DNA-binding CsgD family transcriptional regulator
MGHLSLAKTTVAGADERSPGRGPWPTPVSSTYEADLLLFQAFLDMREHSRGALIALSDRFMVTNHTAGEVVSPGDRSRLWALTQDTLDEGRPRSGVVPLCNGTTVLARCRPVMTAGVPVGALVQLSVPTRNFGGGASARIAGWSQLTDAEQILAELVARGYTNREASKRVFASRHTVDAHLRNVFRKLGISSRAELARLVGEHYLQLCSLEDIPRPYSQPRPAAEQQDTRSA